MKKETDNWITVISFTYSHEAYMAKAILESGGIEVLLKDEYVTQVYSFYSTAIGGVKIQVRRSDYPEAFQILAESGYIPVSYEKPNKIIAWFDTITLRLPLIGKTDIRIRFLILTAIILSCIVVSCVVMTLPSTSDLLTGSEWCVERMTINGEDITLSYKDDYYRVSFNHNNCFEKMYFNKNGTARLPGFDPGTGEALWKLKGDSLTIYIRHAAEEKSEEGSILNPESTPADKNRTFFPGTYHLTINTNSITLLSDSVKITGKTYIYHN